MSLGPLVSHRAGIWLYDECLMAFFMSCLMLRNMTPPFCRYFLCQQFVWYSGYHGWGLGFHGGSTPSMGKVPPPPTFGSPDNAKARLKHN